MKRSLRTACWIGLFILPALCYAQVNQDWVRKFIGTGTDNAAGIAADNSGNIYICGNNNWGYSTADMYTIRYNSAGTQTSGLLYNSPYNNADEARAIATDAAGNVYVAGRASINSSTSDIVLIKYNSSAVQQWVTIYNSPQNYIDDVSAMKVDGSGNIYLAGNIVKGPYEYDYLTLKFNSAGTVLWAATYNGTANGVDMASAIAVDGSGNVFVTGLSAGLAVRRLGTISTGYDYVTIKYDANGVQQWVRGYNYNNGNDEAKSIALDASGNVYITGSSSAGSNNLDCATLKYAADGTVQWIQRYAGAAALNDAGNSIAVDGSGNVFVAGYSYASDGKGDVLTMKYNTSGSLLWLNTYSPSSGTHDIGKVIRLDAYGDAYVASETSVPGVVNSDFLTIKYTTSGVLAWAARYNGPENGSDYPTAMTVVMPNAPPGSFVNALIYVTGPSNGDVITIKYSQPIIFGREGGTGVAQERISPDKFSVGHFPNPVHASFANINYQLPADSRVTITVYDALGRKVCTPVDEFRSAGSHVLRLSTTSLSNGVYHYQCIARSGDKEFRQSNTLVVQKD